MFEAKDPLQNGTIKMNISEVSIRLNLTTKNNNTLSFSVAEIVINVLDFVNM